LRTCKPELLPKRFIIGNKTSISIPQDDDNTSPILSQE
jgi:hypothetical protein